MGEHAEEVDQAANDAWVETINPFMCITNGTWNTLVLGVSFLVLFLAFGATQTFETTLNHNAGIVALLILYTSFGMSCLLVSNPFVALVGPVRSLAVSALGYAFFILCHLFGNQGLLYFAAVVNGVAASILWSAQSMLLAASSTDGSMAKNAGSFFSLFGMFGIAGNLIAAVTLGSSGFSPEGQRVLFVLFTALAVSAAAAMLFLLRTPPVIEARPRLLDIPSIRRSLVQTFALFRAPGALFLLPLLAWMGWMTEFYFGSFASRIPELWLGWVMSIEGLLFLLSSLAAGRIVALLEIRHRHLCALLCGISVAIGILITECFPMSVGGAFVAAAFFGLADGALKVYLYSCLKGISQLMDGGSAVFSFAFLGQALATALAFGLSIYCSYNVMALLFTLLGVAAVVSSYHLSQYLHLRDSTPNPNREEEEEEEERWMTTSLEEESK